MIAQNLLSEFEHELATTRRVLERVPDGQDEFKPHAKSMSLRTLAVHVAEMVKWMTVTALQPELDFAAGYQKPPEITTNAQLLAYFDANAAEAKAALAATSDEAMLTPWTLRNGDQIYFTQPKVGVIRGMVMNHIVHHRGQLSVYLRMLDVPIPAMYGPSADEPMA